MLAQIGYYSLAGKPVVFYLGFLTLATFLLAAAIAVLSLRGIHIIPFKWHPRVAIAAIIIALIHGILAASAYF